MNLFQPLPGIERDSPVKASGLDVESTQTSLLEGGGPPQAVEGVNALR